MKNQIFAFCFLLVSLWIALGVASIVSKLGGITDVNIFVITTLLVWILEFFAAIWISRRR